MSIHNIVYMKTIVIHNQKMRDPLPIGQMVVTSEVMEESLKDVGMSLHTFEPVSVIDKVGFVHHGDAAGDLLLDALQEYAKKMIASGATIPSQRDVLKQMQQDIDDALGDLDDLDII